MKRRLASLLLLPCLLAASQCADAAPPKEAPALSLDFEEQAQLKGCYLNETFASIVNVNPISGNGSLIIDTTSSPSEWSPCFKTPPGFLKGGGDYFVEFKCRNLSLDADSYSLFIIRPFGAENGLSDLGSIAFNVVGPERSFKLPFHVPNGRDDYSFQVHARKKAVALIDDIKIYPGIPAAFLPAKGDAKPSAALNVPSGCGEFMIELPSPKSPLSASVADFGASPESPDNAKAFNDAIASCKASGASKLSVPKGVYRFTSNVPVSFDKLSDFEFDGQGSTFIFLKKKAALFSISGCERSLFKNFNIDWDWDKDPLASVVNVEAIGKDGAYADFKFVDYELFPRRDVRVAGIEQFDPEAWTLSASDKALRMFFEFYQGRTVPKTEWVSGNVLRVYADPDKKGFFLRDLKPGLCFLMRHYYYDMVGVSMQDNAHLTLSGVTIFSCPGHGFVVHGEQHHWQLVNSNILRPPGTRRPMTCTADHHHVAQSRGYMKMDGCQFSLGGDDFLNIHDSSGFAVKGGAASVSTRNVNNMSSYHIGDTVELRNDDYSPTGFSAKITEKKPVDPKRGIHEISFDKDVPEQRGEGFILFNRRYDSGHVIVRNCKFFDAPPRRLLLLAHDVTVEGNSFSKAGSVKIETGYTLNVWSEGYGASNIVIKNNVFDMQNPRAAYKAELTPAIYMSVYLKSDPSVEKTKYPILRDILIENNRFVNCPGAIAYACSAKNVIVRGNTIVNDVPRGEDLLFRGAVGTSWSSEVFVTGNKWISSPLTPKPGLFYDSETSSDVYCWGNEIVEGPSAAK